MRKWKIEREVIHLAETALQRLSSEDWQIFSVQDNGECPVENSTDTVITVTIVAYKDE